MTTKPIFVCIKLRPPEIQSGMDRVRWAELLIRQLPEDHEGRNSWLLNYAGSKHEIDKQTKQLEDIDVAIAKQLGESIAANSKLANKLREAEATITRMESELDTINNQHRVMAKQLAEAGERLKTTTKPASALKSRPIHYTQERLDAIYEASKLDYAMPLVGSEVRALIGDIRNLWSRLDELDRDT